MLRLLVFTLSLLSLCSSPAAEGVPTFAKDIKPLLEKYCYDCHGDGAEKGDLNLDPFTDEASIKKASKVWQSIHFNIDNWMMPPPKKDQPTTAERQLLTSWMDSLLNPFDPNKPDPGRVTIRKLNRVEYNNTIRDLLGLNTQPANDFPEDDSGYGFDVIGDVLTLSPILMERYMSSAEKVLDAAFNARPPESVEHKFAPVALTGNGKRVRDQNVYTLSDNGAVGIRHFFPATGTYRLRAKAYGDQAGDEPVKLEFSVDGKTVAVVDVKADSFEKSEHLFTVAAVEAGSRRFSARFINDFYDEKLPEGKRDRNLHILRLGLEGPIKISENDPSFGGMARKILAPLEKVGEKPEAARTILQVFANRAFRRPTQTVEVDRLMKIFQFSLDQGEPYKASLINAMKAVLISPYFLYRMEWQAEPNNPAEVVELSEMALASRLSYFLWSSMPDDELFKLAKNNELRKNFRPQVQRMLLDSKAKALVQNFGGQWLETRSLDAVQPNPKTYRYPGYLRDAMRTETESFFWNLIQENRSVLEFISADYTFANENLARHYGIPGVTGEDFQKVSFPNHVKRRGILTHGSVLTITSDPTRTSPVKRGKWIMENILGIPAPPPPPNVPTLEEDENHKEGGGQSIRQKLEEHRSKPGCASCHALIDPLGFGLENFDPIGAHRAFDNGQPIDSTGVLTTGQKFTNAIELSALIVGEKRDNFLRCLIQKSLTYALGRGLESYDRPAVDTILANLKKDDCKMESLILNLVESLPFQKRRGDARPAPAPKPTR